MIWNDHFHDDDDDNDDNNNNIFVKVILLKGTNQMCYTVIPQIIWM